jgi:hypothetical protein
MNLIKSSAIAMLGAGLMLLSGCHDRDCGCCNGRGYGYGGGYSYEAPYTTEGYTEGTVVNPDGSVVTTTEPARDDRVIINASDRNVERRTDINTNPTPPSNLPPPNNATPPNNLPPPNNTTEVK